MFILSLSIVYALRVCVKRFFLTILCWPFSYSGNGLEMSEVFSVGELIQNIF